MPRRRPAGGIGLREMIATQTVEIVSRTAIAPYVAATPSSATAIPPAAGPTIPPVCDTLLVHDTPRAASSSGMTCASNADRAGRSNPLATPVANTTRRIAEERDPRRARRQDRQDQRAERHADAGHDHDRAPVASIGEVTAEQHERQRRDRLDQPEPAEGQRIAGDVVGLERDDGRERAHRQRVRQPGTEQGAELARREDRWPAGSRTLHGRRVGRVQARRSGSGSRMSSTARTRSQ